MNRAIKTLLFAAVVFMLSACGDDDPKISGKLVGTWNVKGEEVQIIVPDDDLRHFLIAEYGMGPQDADQYADALESGDAYKTDVISITFKNDGTYTSQVGAGTNPTGVWELSSDEKTLTIDKGTDRENTLPVSTLTDTQLIMKFDFTDAVGLSKLQYFVLITFGKE